MYTWNSVRVETDGEVKSYTQSKEKLISRKSTQRCEGIILSTYEQERIPIQLLKQGATGTKGRHARKNSFQL